jgi:predicted flavoprotein YhiN
LKPKPNGPIYPKHIAKLIQSIDKRNFSSEWKSTFKEEFVTAGGINLKEINFKTMESKLHENLYFAGEIVNIDAITGGFNFRMLGRVGLFWLIVFSEQ